ncbi:MAG TPA: DUF2934 domain-containing protein [Bryobacteraceae bacterium]|jgi:hypothetical protein
MIDPKLNKVPAQKPGAFENLPAAPRAEPRSGPIRRGLSVNDTIAADANRSVGARGVDTSGVEAGAGAAAEMTSITPDTDDIIRESRLGSSDEIAARAYQYWCERGCPEGSPEVDWQLAEEELRTKRANTRAAGASA